MTQQHTSHLLHNHFYEAENTLENTPWSRSTSLLCFRMVEILFLNEFKVLRTRNKAVEKLYRNHEITIEIMKSRQKSVISAKSLWFRNLVHSSKSGGPPGIYNGHTHHLVSMHAHTWIAERLLRLNTSKISLKSSDIQITITVR